MDNESTRAVCRERISTRNFFKTGNAEDGSAALIDCKFRKLPATVSLV